MKNSLHREISIETRRKAPLKTETKKKITKKVAAKKKETPRTFDEIRNIARRAKSYHIVKGRGYLYFCVQPSQETVVFQQILKRPQIKIAAVYNFKDTIIGYLVEFPKEKPHLDISKGAEGAAIFFDKKTAHKKPKILFADQKLRVLSFSNKDFYVSVKWKSNQIGDDT